MDEGCVVWGPDFWDCCIDQNADIINFKQNLSYFPELDSLTRAET